MIIRNILLMLLISKSMTLKSQEKNIDISTSNVIWTGKEITTKTHFGSLKFEKGNILINNGFITAGEFIVDMQTLENHDLSGGSKSYLEKHLRSEDFFAVEKYPTATLKVISSEKVTEKKFSVLGELTIKGITNSINFDLTYNETGAFAELIFDRSKYNVKFRSSTFFEELGDKLIYDDIELKVDLVF